MREPEGNSGACLNHTGYKPSWKDGGVQEAAVRNRPTPAQQAALSEYPGWCVPKPRHDDRHYLVVIEIVSASFFLQSRELSTRVPCL